MKTAWIFPGGAARGVYTAGVIYALCEMAIPKPDIIIAASASAPTILCYITGQYEIIPQVWLESLSTRKFVNFWRFWKVLNINYLIDYVLKKKHPLDMVKVANSDILIYFPLTDAQTGKIEYFSNKMSVDLWEIIRASISIPIVTNLFSVKGSQVNGKWFFDSAPAGHFQSHIGKAIQEGAEKIIVFNNWLAGDNPHPHIFPNLLAKVRSHIFRANQLRHMEEVAKFSPPVGIEFIKLEPKTNLGMGRFEIDNQIARTIFKRGYEDTFNDEVLNLL